MFLNKNNLRWEFLLAKLLINSVRILKHTSFAKLALGRLPVPLIALNCDFVHVLKIENVRVM